MTPRQFHELADCDFMVNHIYAAQIPSQDFEVYNVQSRADNQLFYLRDGMREYLCKDATRFVVCGGDVVFMPEGCSYHSRSVNGSGTGYGVIFRLYDETGYPLRIGQNPVKLLTTDDDDYRNLYLRLIRHTLHDDVGALRAKETLCALLERLLSDLRAQAQNEAHPRIAPALKYIEKNLDKNLSVSELAALCHMSISSFYRCFRECTLVAPSVYHQRMRIDKSRELLESGLYTVEQAASFMGFCDSAYFSKLFRRLTGQTASKCRPRRH